MRRAKRILISLFSLTTIGILVCTLWPFNLFPRNRVSWLMQTNGLRFDRRGVVISEQRLELASARSSNHSCSIELWFKPAQTNSVSTILDFYEFDEPWRFRVQQYLTGLIISREIIGPDGRSRRVKVDLDGLQQGRLSFLTLSSGAIGTSAYLDGKRIGFFPHFRIFLGDLSGRLVLGSSPVYSDPWWGEIHGLAIYSRELTAEEVLASYRAWTNENARESGDPVSAIARYTFSERAGNSIRNQSGITADAGVSLTIPGAFRVPQHSFLMPFWREFEYSSRYLWDVIQNIAGFMPFGFLLCALLLVSGRCHRSVLYSTLCGAMLSLCIETLQAYIPQRASGMTDILTNTLGTALGALLAHMRIVQITFQKIGLASLREMFETLADERTSGSLPQHFL